MFSRKCFAIFLLAALTCLAPFAAAEPLEWRFDPVHSYVGFKVRHLMVSWVRGQFTEAAGTIWHDSADPASSRLEITINPASIDTHNERRDTHLRSADFFDVEKFPEMKFVSKKVTKAGELLKVTGDLTMHGVTKEVTLDVEGPTPSVDLGAQGQKTGATASATLKRADWGLTWNRMLEAGGMTVGDEIYLEIEAELTRGGTGKKGKKAGD